MTYEDLIYYLCYNLIVSMPDNSHLPKQASLERRKVLSVGLVILSIRPFGFRTFLNGLGHDNIFSLSLIVSLVPVVLVISQRIEKKRNNKRGVK